MKANKYQYWAAQDPETLGEKLAGFLQANKTNKTIRGLNDEWARAYLYYYGKDPNTGDTTDRMSRAGEQGELAAVRVNHARSLVNTLHAIITSAKVIWAPKAENVDYDSIQETKLAAALLEYYWDHKRVQSFSNSSLESAIALSEGFVLAEWDPSIGWDVAGVNGRLERSGDVRLTQIMPWDIIRDPTKKSWGELDWVGVVRRINKFDLMELYPTFAEDICESPTIDKDLSRGRGSEVDDFGNQDIEVCYFYHRRGPAVQAGRQAICLMSGKVIQDSPLQTEDFPLSRVCPTDRLNTPYGYTQFNEILGMQELMDNLHSAIATNQTTLATQCIAVEQGSEFSPDDIMGGMKVLYVPPGSRPPSALQLTQTAPEVFNYLQALKKDQEQIFGVNSVVRGEPYGADNSGAALALLHSQALQQANTLQGNWHAFLEHLGTNILFLIRDNMKADVQVEIAGKEALSLLAVSKFNGESFNRIRRVNVELGNPLQHTAGGRMQIAQSLLQSQLVKTPEQYMMVMETGRLEPITQSTTMELSLIRQENEMLARGEQPVAVALDEHLLHAKEHRSVLASPNARNNPQVVQAVLSHIQEHESLYFGVPPQTLMMVGQQPPPQMAPPGMAPPGAEGQPPQEGAPPGQNPGEAAMPSPPTNPATGEQWNPVDGGGAVQTK